MTSWNANKAVNSTPSNEPIRNEPVNSIEEEYALANSQTAQFELIKAAYDSGDDHEIEQALLTVQYARDSLRNGILDMIRDID